MFIKNNFVVYILCLADTLFSSNTYLVIRRSVFVTSKYVCSEISLVIYLTKYFFSLSVELPDYNLVLEHNFADISTVTR